MTDLNLSEDQQQIAAAAAAVLQDHDTRQRTRLLHEDPAAVDALWSEVVRQGWLRLGVPEECGGIGFGPAEQVVLAREIGRWLLPAPILAGMLAASVPGPHQREVMDGARVGLIRRSGPTVLVLHGDRCDFLLELDAAGGRILPEDALTNHRLVPSTDPGTPVVVAEISDPTPLAATEGPHLLWRGRVLVAAIACGISEATLSMAVAHARTREQFGRPIGAFQAIKHRCADMAVRADAAWAQTRWAALVFSTDPRAADFETAAAAHLALGAARRNAADNVQIHGALGFTWEADPHLYVTCTQMLAVALEHPHQRVDAIMADHRHRSGS